MPRMNDLSGKRYGHLVAQWPVGRNVLRKTMWLCLCDCGKIHIARGTAMTTGNTKTCGCNEKTNAKTHGYGYSDPVYRAWRYMISRCENPNRKFFCNWGGRGIKVCERWRNSFLAFLEDMGQKPSPKHSIDRINNDGNYEPGNVRWATPLEQVHNRRVSPAIRLTAISKGA